MKCSVRVLSLMSLGIGLISVGTLSLAVSTDYWLYAEEVTPCGAMCEPPAGFNGTLPEELGPELVLKIHSYSGLWRVCLFSPDYEYNMVPDCESINYLGQTWERISDAYVTMNVARAIRKSAPLIVVSLFVVITAFSVTTIGNAKRDVRTLIGAVLYIFSALLLAFGTILYIAAVNDETAHKKKPPGDSGAGFTYGYRWAFFCAGTSFMASKITAVINISLYLRRYEKLEDITAIIPGLEKRGDAESGREETGSHNPTIIL